MGAARDWAALFTSVVRQGLPLEQILEGAGRSDISGKSISDRKISKFKGPVVEASHLQDSKEARVSTVEKARGRAGGKVQGWGLRCGGPCGLRGGLWISFCVRWCALWSKCLSPLQMYVLNPNPQGDGVRR